MMSRKEWLYPVLFLSVLTLGGCGGGGGSTTPDTATDTTPPVFSSMVPANTATGVSPTTSIQMTFNENLNCAAATAVLVPAATGSLTCNGATLTFNPSADLNTDTLYTLTVSAVADSAGNSLLSPVIKSFRTAVFDTAAPEVVSAMPVNAANFVTPQSTISAVFNEALVSSTVTANFTLAGPSGNVAGAATYNAATKTATFTPSVALAAGVYTATLNTGITDLAGIALASPYTWSFTVVASPAFTAAPVFSAGQVEPGTPVELTLQVTPNAYDVLVCLEPVAVSATRAATVETNGCTTPSIVNSPWAGEIKLTVNTTFAGVFYPTVVLTESGTGTPPRSFYSRTSDSPNYQVTVAGDDVLTNIVVPFLVVGAAPDLQATINSATLVGTNLTVGVTVKNLGSSSSVATNLDIFADAAAAPVVGQTGGERVEVPALAIGETSTPISVVVPNVAVAPSLVYALADSTGVVTESDESNNVATWVVLAAPQETKVSADVPLVIPYPNVSSSLQVESAITSLRYVAVKLDITHTFDEDLILTLISPSGTEVILSNGRGGSGDNFTATLFHDGAAISIAAGSAPYTGAYSPEGSLAALLGENPDGLWSLKIEDSNDDLDWGTLNSWSLLLW